MALASGVGVRFVGNREPEDKRDEACLFGEASALYLVAVNEAQLKKWDSKGFMPGRLGVFGGEAGDFLVPADRIILKQRIMAGPCRHAQQDDERHDDARGRPGERR